jgi:hypothetical protein
LIEIPSVRVRVGGSCECTFRLSRSFYETGAFALDLLGSCLLASHPPRDSCRAGQILVEQYLPIGEALLLLHVLCNFEFVFYNLIEIGNDNIFIISEFLALFF